MGSASASIQAARAIHQRLLADSRLQFDFPSAPTPTMPRLPAWLDAVGRFLAHIVQAIFPALKVVFWLGLGLALLAVVFLIVREIAGAPMGSRRARRAERRRGPVDWRPDAAKARALLADADALAASGDYDGAVHLILLTSIEDIEGRRPRVLAPALTARDIAGLEALPARARDAFAGMARIVERSLFGGRPAGAEGFAHCRADYQAFALDEAWR
ncbi:MAG: DUF4129 domain-containing protein [Caulobacteraceae bacterium]